MENLSFKDFAAIQEAIRIVRRAEDNPNQQTKGVTGKIGSVGGYDIILTKHVHDTRGNEKGGRGEGLLKRTFHNVVDKLLKIKKDITDGFYHLIYKVGKAYNDMIVNIDHDKKKISVVTVIQHERPNPHSYKVKPGDKKVVIEKSFGITINETIDLGEIEL